MLNYIKNNLGLVVTIFLGVIVCAFGAWFFSKPGLIFISAVFLLMFLVIYLIDKSDETD